MWINVHPVSGTGIRTHNLRNMSLPHNCKTRTPALEQFWLPMKWLFVLNGDGVFQFKLNEDLLDGLLALHCTIVCTTCASRKINKTWWCTFWQNRCQRGKAFPWRTRSAMFLLPAFQGQSHGLPYSDVLQVWQKVNHDILLDWSLQDNFIIPLIHAKSKEVGYFLLHHYMIRVIVSPFSVKREEWVQWPILLKPLRS